MTPTSTTGFDFNNLRTLLAPFLHVLPVIFQNKQLLLIPELTGRNLQQRTDGDFIRW